MVYKILTQSHKVTNKQGRMHVEGRGGPRGCRPKRGPLAKKFKFFRIFLKFFTFWAIFGKHFSLFSSKNLTFYEFTRKSKLSPFLVFNQYQLTKLSEIWSPRAPNAKPGPGAAYPLTPLSTGLQTKSILNLAYVAHSSNDYNDDQIQNVRLSLH